MKGGTIRFFVVCRSFCRRSGVGLPKVAGAQFFMRAPWRADRDPPVRCHMQFAGAQRPITCNLNLSMRMLCCKSCKMGGHRLRSSLYSGDRNLVSSLSAAVYVEISKSFARLYQDYFKEPLWAPELPATSEGSFLASSSHTPFL